MLFFVVEIFYKQIKVKAPSDLLLVGPRKSQYAICSKNCFALPNEALLDQGRSDSGRNKTSRLWLKKGSPLKSLGLVKGKRSKH